MAIGGEIGEEIDISIYNHVDEIRRSIRKRVKTRADTLFVALTVDFLIPI